MKTTFLHTKNGIFRFVFLAVCLLFAAFSAIVFLCLGGFSQAFLCFVCGLAMLTPNIFEWLFKVRAATSLYVFVLLYACGPILGYPYKFYYLIPGWDTLLHICGGVAFAILGAYLPRLFDKNQEPSLLLCALFGFCFSIAVSGVWEFIEYGFDTFFGTDMQSDRLIGSITSYLLGGELGVTGSIPTIESVIVNGQPLEGYIDIGLFDTMKDMLVETLGALVYSLIFIVDKGNHCGLTPITSSVLFSSENAVE